jgi:hypothetical protein
MHTGLWLENLKERQCLENLTIDVRIILKCILVKQNGRVQTECI